MKNGLFTFGLIISSLCQTACRTTGNHDASNLESTQSSVQSESSAPSLSGSGSLAGTWDVRVANFQGKLQIQRSLNSNFEGTISFPSLGTVDSVRGSMASNGQFSFTRRISSGGSQVWKGRLSSSTLMVGSWTGNGGSGAWSATLPANQKIVGSWAVKVAQFNGTMNLSSVGQSKFEGAISFAVFGTIETIQEGQISSDGQLSFVRVIPTGGTQNWSGVLSNDGTMQGSWHGFGGSGGLWSAKKSNN